MIGGYRVESLLGRGGMGVVYRAEQIQLGRPVALKLMAPEVAQDPGIRQRFIAESRLAAAIDHPNILPLYEAGIDAEVPFIAARLVEGIDLKELLVLEGPLAPERAVSIAGQVAAALDAAHARGLVHRDVKPGNVLVARDAGTGRTDHCYLTDFGLTKRIASGTGLTATGHFVGTLDYMAPEQMGGGTLDGRADQYALACLFFECLSGHVPFARESDVAAMWAHVNESPPALSAARPGLPPALDAVLARALAKEPGGRYESCGAFVAAARNHLLVGFTENESFQPESVRLAPALLVLVPIAACAGASYTQAGRMRGGSPRRRLLWGAATAVPFAIAMLICALGAGSVELTVAAKAEASVGGSFFLALLWGGLGGAAGTWMAMRREGAAPALALPARARFALGLIGAAPALSPSPSWSQRRSAPALGSTRPRVTATTPEATSAPPPSRCSTTASTRSSTVCTPSHSVCWRRSRSTPAAVRRCGCPRATRASSRARRRATRRSASWTTGAR